MTRQRQKCCTEYKDSQLHLGQPDNLPEVLDGAPMSSPTLKRPDANQTGWPKGIPYIIGNEGCERFSYYGMSAILYIYALSIFIDHSVAESDAAAKAISTVHFFKTGVYALPMLGAIIADRLLGKYRTILYLSLVYCLGHLVLSLTEGSINGMYAGLALIAIGSGGIKPCVSANVGDQFGASNFYLVEKVYQGFYFIINFGSFFATLSIPLLQKWFGFQLAFAIPGVLMFIATLVFWAGGKHFVDVPAKPGGRLGRYDAASSCLLFMTVGSLMFTASMSPMMMVSVSTFFLVCGLLVFGRRQQIEEDDGFLAVSLFAIKEWMGNAVYRVMVPAFAATGRRLPSQDLADRFYEKRFEQSMQARFSSEALEGAAAVVKLISVFILVSIFWALFDQHSSSWIRQAAMMDRHMTLPFVGAVEALPSQIQSLNPIMVMLLIPFVSLVIIPLVRKMGMEVTPLRKIAAGMFIASASFGAVALIQGWIDASSAGVPFLWQSIPYVLLTVSEVLVSITGLEFAYSQAPRRMKSTIMGFWLLSVALGNVLVALLARFGNLGLADFFWVFAGLMLIAALLFSVRAYFYQSKVITQ
jgi:POT family proton-dependent oligopeptide transporter